MVGLRGVVAERVAPFPFISTALTLGGASGRKKGLNDRVHPERFNLSFDGGKNDNGVMIVDIAKEARPTYCFTTLKEIARDPSYPTAWRRGTTSR